MYYGEIYLRVIYSFLILFAFLIFKNIITKIIIGFLKKISERYKLKGMALTADSLEKPLRNFFIYTGIYCAATILPLSDGASLFAYKIFRTCIIITVTQCLLNIVTAYTIVINSNVIDQAGKPPVLKTLFPILHKIIKVLIIILAVVIVAAEFDFKQLNSILAGIGIGGAAIALASQDLIKNFFGGFVVLTDKSFNVGDFINIDSYEGIVEELGFRSTKIRTLEQELIVVPNSKFTDKAVINYTKRNMRRVSFRLGTAYSTSSEKLKELLNNINEMLNSNLMVKENSVVVKFDRFGQDSLEILIQYMINTSDYGLYMSIKDEINFMILELFEKEKVSIAFPSMSIYMEKNNIKD